MTDDQVEEGKNESVDAPSVPLSLGYVQISRGRKVPISGHLRASGYLSLLMVFFESG
jgi:hypothetical protein